jgi:oligopeptide/dipeptide ABC transporter ATP-binding protein
MVIYLGRLVEIARRDVLFDSSIHPYTRALLSSVPDPTRALAGTRPVVTGELPAGSQAPSGCAFRDRCPHAEPVCAATVPALEPMGEGHSVACHRRRELVYS